ncbi:MAG TPA: aldose epimerase family protein [Opitutaceae bacterium]|nr:aldose epimerase family protein [Opitutaceae bacterium]
MALSQAPAASVVEKKPFGAMPDGRPITLYRLTGPKGLVVEVMDYGATLVSVLTPDRTGKVGDVLLGYANGTDYTKSSTFFGATIGRVANRIADAHFTLDGKTYELLPNNRPGGMPCTLHGGAIGFDKVLWTAQPIEAGEAGPASVRFEYLSKDGEEGFPGNLSVRVTYSMTEDNGVRIDYEATTDAPTPVSLTNHSYFNLSGEGNGLVLDHELTLHAARFTPVNRGLIPTGELRPVEGTPFDFRKPHRVGERIGEKDEQLEFGGGYDHNFVIDRKGAGLDLAATVFDPASGRVLEVLTTEPGVQLYSGNFLDGGAVGKSGKPYPYRSALALETQGFPDAVNQPNFPSIVLRPGSEYKSTTVFRFSTR